MQETKRMADEAERMGEEAQEQAGRMGQDFQKAAPSRHGSARSMLGLAGFNWSPRVHDAIGNVRRQIDEQDLVQQTVG